MEFELGGKRPKVHPDAYIAPTAVLIGDVEVESGASVWFGAVLRADEAQIRIGEGSNIQDNVVIHCAEDLPTVVGRNATVGHSAQLEGCVVEEGALVGMGAFLAATTHAPIMAIIMIFELTLDYQIILPLMLACVVGYYTSVNIEKRSIYAEALKRKGAGDYRKQLAELHVRDLMKKNPLTISRTAGFSAIGPWPGTMTSMSRLKM